MSELARWVVSKPGYALVEVVVLGVAARGATVIAQLGHTLGQRQLELPVSDN